MNERFVSFNEDPELNNLIICLDAEYWTSNKRNILEYVQANNGIYLGDRIFWFTTDCDRTWFMLKWN
jgi:hypothetical protein